VANGFRLAIMRDPPEVRTLASTIDNGDGPPRDVQTLEPVSAEVFAAYASFFSYEHSPLNATIEEDKESRLWTRQRITFDSPYSDDREVLYLFLPTSGSPPYQTVFFWSGALAYVVDSFDDELLPVDFIIQSGRALALPVYSGTYERRNDRGPPFAPTSEIAYRDDMVEGVIDLRRSLDYLETRADINPDAIGYFGFSMGAVQAPIALAWEPRIKVAVGTVGFIPPRQLEPPADPLQALPRVTQPFLLLSGEFDSTARLPNARRYFELLGTPAADKKHVVTQGGHFVPREQLVRETLDWLDRYLGSSRQLRSSL